VPARQPQIAPLLEKTRNAEDRRIAVCIVDDLLEHSAAGRLKYFSTVRGRGAGRGWAGRGVEEQERAMGVAPGSPRMGGKRKGCRELGSGEGREAQAWCRFFNLL
jgi:hypothetical protein